MANVFPVLAGVLMLGVAVTKIGRFHDFRKTVSAYEPWIDERVTAVSWIAIEATAAILLFVPQDWRFSPAAAVVGIASGAVARRVTQGASHDCGCGGRTHAVSWRILARNAILLAGGAYLSFSTIGTDAARSVLLVAAVGVSLGFVSVGHVRRAPRRTSLPHPRPTIEKVTGF